MSKVTLDGVEYSIRRLGLSDMFAVQQAASEVITGAALRGVNLADSMEGSASNQIVAFIFAGMSFAKESITEWINSLIEMPNPEDKFTKDIYLEDLPGLVEALASHRDIKSFLANAKGMIENLVKVAPQE